MPQSLSSVASDMRPVHHDRTETEDPLLGMVNYLSAKAAIVVFFDQQMGAPQAVHWSKSCFDAKTTFSIFFRQ